MVKPRHKVYFLTLIAVLLAGTSLIIPVPVAARGKDMIRIGLFYNGSAQSEVELSATRDLSLGYIGEEGDFHPVINEPVSASWRIRPDVYRVQVGVFPTENEAKAAREVVMKLGVSVVRIIPPEPGHEGWKLWAGSEKNLADAQYIKDLLRDAGYPAFLIGANHLVLTENFADWPAAAEKAKNLREYGLAAYPAFDGAWRVYVGHFVRPEEAGNEEEKIADVQRVLQKTFRLDTELVEDSKQGLEIIAPDMTLFAYYQYEKPLTAIGGKNSEGVSLVKVYNRQYRGKIELARLAEGKLTVINELPLEEYLYGVVPKEMSESWPLEALKAQAVAARTFAYKNMNRFASLGFNLDATQATQAYGGYDVEGPRSRQAVDETRGQVLTYQGELANIYYYASSGGYTENSENVWSTPYPYLVGVPDPFDDVPENKNSEWIQDFTAADIAAALAKQKQDIGLVYGMEIVSTGVSGRVTALKILGEKGEALFQKDAIRGIFAVNEKPALKSTLFSVSADSEAYVLNAGGEVKKVQSLGALPAVSAGGSLSVPGGGALMITNGEATVTLPGYPTRFYFAGRGWGHGVGMSQWGAYGMAKQGYNYKDILAQYFQGTSVTMR